MNYLITGGTGFLGGHLTRKLLGDYQSKIWLLTRGNKQSTDQRIHYLPWDGKQIPSIRGNIDVVINLAGKGIAEARWSESNKKEILQSRIDASKACVDFIQKQKVKPSVFIAGSAIGFYGGDRPGPEVVDETSIPGSDFMGMVCTQWEAASSDSGIRTVFLRTGIILGKNDGPWEKLFQPYKYFVGGPLASGEQGFPWMHVDDWVNAVILCIEKSSISGPVILTAPEAITMDQFSNAIAKGSGKPNFFRVPKFALSMLLGEQSIIVWGGVLANPAVLKNSEFKWKFSDAVAAVKDLVS